MNLSRPAASITLAAADALAAAAIAAARDIGFAAAVAISDAGGHLRAFRRDDSASPFPTDMAIRKARIAATSGLPTHQWNDLVAIPALAPMAALPGMMAVAGGYPLRDGAVLVGGIGVSGGDPQQDRDAALRALIAIGFSED